MNAHVMHNATTKSFIIKKLTSYKHLSFVVDNPELYSCALFKKTNNILCKYKSKYIHVKSSQSGKFKKAGVLFKNDTVRVTSSPAFRKT